MKYNPPSRRVSRIAFVQSVYQFEQTEIQLNQIASQFLTYHFPDKLKTYPDKQPANEDFYLELMRGLEMHLTDIDNVIKDHLTEEWSFERIISIVKTILRCSLYELKYQPLIPHPVVINEYIEITKMFTNEKDVKFINAILDKISKK